MSKLIIYKYGTIVARATVEPDTTSQQSVSLMREDILLLNFESPILISFQIGDYCTFAGRLYQINQLPQRSRISDDNITYSLTMEAEYYDLAKVSFMFLDANNNFTEAVFPLRGRLQDFGDLIIFNLKRVFPTATWILGLVDSTDYMTIDFSAQNCLQVLTTLASSFTTEYLIEGKKINLYQRNSSSGLTLQYGQDQPLLNLTEANQDQSNVITRLYAFGSNKNLPVGYRGDAQFLRMGALEYIEKNVALYRVQEFTKLFDGTNGTTEIYPHRTGTVTAVDDPFNFYDTGMDFDVNAYLISGVTAQVVFNTGLLSGYTFPISAYNATTKKFTILQDTDETTIVVPSVTYTPAIGDTYVIVNITMPTSYITAAEAALKTAAQDFLNDNCTPPIVYSTKCNAKWFKENNATFSLGQTVQVVDTGMSINRNTRITAYTRNVSDVYLYTMELSDTVKPTSIIVKLLNGL